jgi:hypothetical protein
MSLFTYIKYPVEPYCRDTEWYKTLPEEIIKKWCNHKDVRHLSSEDLRKSQEEVNRIHQEIRIHNINILKKIILEWEDD